MEAEDTGHRLQPKVSIALVVTGFKVKDKESVSHLYPKIIEYLSHYRPTCKASSRKNV